MEWGAVDTQITFNDMSCFQLVICAAFHLLMIVPVRVTQKAVHSAAGMLGAMPHTIVVTLWVSILCGRHDVCLHRAHVACKCDA